MLRIEPVILCALILGAATAGTAGAGPLEFRGEISHGETLIYRFAYNSQPYEFRLVPIGGGWTIWIDRPAHRDRNYVAAVTPPFRGINPAVIQGWHFRGRRDPTDNEANEGKVNAPQKERHFAFVPDAAAYQEAEEALAILLRPEGRTEREMAAAQDRLAKVPRIEGVLRIEAIEFGNLADGEQTDIEQMAFSVRLELP